MRRSALFLPTMKETPTEAQIASHRLMLRAGMVRQSAAGIYSWLPLGLRVLRNIEQIVREEQDRAGAQEMLMPTIQSAELWRKSGRYDDYGKEMLRIVDRGERELLYGPTNEELITDIFASSVRSYRDLPKNLYHIQWKFRDEIRPRFGVMRGREFLMKDAYSFDLDKEGARRSYLTMFVAYLRTFARMGLRAVPVHADPGAIGGNMSHEFHILADTGESDVYFDAAFEDYTVGQMLNADLDMVARMEGLYAAADEKHDAAACPIPADRLRQRKGIEVGHIFYFGTKYSEPMGASVTSSTGESVAVEMGSYGVGVSRLVGAIIEASHDEKGIVWPESVAPYKVVLINLRHGDADCTAAADGLYERLQNAGIDTLYDDRDERPGVKFADADLIGVPWQVVIGPRGVKAGVVEFKNRATGETLEITPEAALDRLSAKA
ncbi:proline--tRNA ligase [Emcibacter sp. SYSU 3D8]|uniref:proline--tRNA ligase n=1 Tax=Emcibacter sp. SYSU 3D8 TaxID=3133969 RepID=UPI0031FF46D8